MVYIRRYLSGQQATTVTIAQGAITADKIVDGAVTHPKLAPGSVDSERVINESLKSEDIKDGEIKTPDVQDGAITTPKIADGAVTTQKLEASIQGIARPLTPGVDTDEIQNAKVTLAKLAPDSVDASKIKPGAVGASELAGNAVETVKVKDANITLAKMAPDSIDNTVIKANTIRGTEIAAGAISTPELSTDAVETVKVKDRNITGVKVALDGIISENIADGTHKDISRRDISNGPTFYDDFEGAALSSRWVQTAKAGGLVTLVDSEVRIITGVGAFDYIHLGWGGKELVQLSDAKPTFVVRAKLLRDKFQDVIMGLRFDDDNYIAFRMTETVGGVGTWDAVCRSGGAETVEDAQINANFVLREFKFVYVSDNQVDFYIDGIFRTSIFTNIPSTRKTEPHFYILSRVGLDNRSVDLDYVQVFNTRS